MKGIIFDTNIFRKIIDGLINLEDIKKIKEKNNFISFTTHIQMDELNSCKDIELKTELLKIFKEIEQEFIPTEGIVFDTSKFNMANFSNNNLLDEIKNDNPKNIEDALIGATAIKNNLILVTNDKNLKNKVIKNGGKAIDLKEFKEILN